MGFDEREEIWVGCRELWNHEGFGVPSHWFAVRGHSHGERAPIAVLDIAVMNVCNLIGLKPTGSWGASTEQIDGLFQVFGVTQWPFTPTACRMESGKIKAMPRRCKKPQPRKETDTWLAGWWEAGRLTQPSRAVAGRMYQAWAGV